NYDPQLISQVATNVAQRIKAIDPKYLGSFDMSDPTKFLQSVSSGVNDPKVLQDLIYKPIEAQQKNVTEARLAAELNKPEVKGTATEGLYTTVRPFGANAPQLPPLPVIPGQPMPPGTPRIAMQPSSAPVQTTNQTAPQAGSETIQPGQWAGTGPNPGTYTAQGGGAN